MSSSQDSLEKTPPSLLPIFLIVLVDILALTIILPLLPFYAEKLGASPVVVGLLVSVFAFCQLISGPILGHLSDRYGRKPLLILSQMGTCAGLILLGQAETLFWVFVARALDGFTAGNLSIAQAYISDITTPANRAKAFGMIGVAFGLGFLVGPAFSGYLSQFGYHFPVYAAAGLSALSILTTFLLLPRTPQPAQNPEPLSTSDSNELQTGPPVATKVSVFQLRAQWKKYGGYFERPDLGPLLVQFFLFVISFALFTSGFALFAERRLFWNGRPFGPQEVGYVFAYSGFLGIFFQGGLIGRLVKRFGEQRLVLWGFTSSLLSYAVLYFTHSVEVLLVGATLGSFGNSALRPALTSLVTQNAHRNEQGAVLGLTQSLMSIAQILAPLVSGFLIEHQLLSSWAFCCGCVSMAGLAFSRKLLSAST